MDSTVVKRQSQKGKVSLHVYLRRERINNFGKLKTVLPKLIGEDQKVCLFFQRQIHWESIRLLYTLLFANKHQVPGLLLTVDFEKEKKKKSL